MHQTPRGGGDDDHVSPGALPRALACALFAPGEGCGTYLNAPRLLHRGASPAAGGGPPGEPRPFTVAGFQRRAVAGAVSAGGQARRHAALSGRAQCAG